MGKASSTEVRWAGLRDEDLVRAALAELDGSLDELVRRYETRVRACARRMALDPERVEDLVQEVFLRMLASLDRFEGRSAFGTWLFRLAHNTCIDTFRRDVRAARTQCEAPGDPDGIEELPEPLDRLAADWGDPYESLEGSIVDCYLGQALAALPEDYRQVLRLRLAHGLSTQESADRLGTTDDAVKAKLKRARQQVREHLTERRSCPFCRGRYGVGSTGHLE